MARDLNGTTDHIDYSNVFDPTGSAITIAAWLWLDVQDQDRYAVHMEKAPPSSGMRMISDNGVTVDGVALFRDTDTGFYVKRRNGAGGLGTGAWQHVIGESDAGGTSANMELWVDGALPAGTFNSGAGTVDPATGLWVIGGKSFADDRGWDGRIAEVGVWDRELGADERNALAKGFAPSFFRNSLRFYAPLIRDPNDRGPTGKVATLDGTSVIEHPPIIYPN